MFFGKFVNCCDKSNIYQFFEKKRCSNCWMKKKGKKSLGKFLELYRKIELFLAKFKYKGRRIKKVRRNLFEWTGCTIRRWLERARFLFFLPVHWSGFKVKRPPFQLVRKAFQKISMKITMRKHREIFYKTRWKKSLVKSVTFIEIKEKKDWTTHHYVKTVRLNVILKLSIFQEEKNISIFEQMHKENIKWKTKSIDRRIIIKKE